MTDESESDKTEQPTPYKLDRSRKKGVVARGADLGLMAASGAALAYFWIGGGSFVQTIARAIRVTLSDESGIADSPLAIATASTRLIWFVAPPLLLFFALVFVSVLVVEIVQTGGTFSVAPLTPQARKSLGIEASVEGLYVDHVKEVSPAFDANIRDGDVITQVDGRAVTSTDEFARIVKGAKKGDYLRLYVLRPQAKVSFFALVKIED